MLLVPKVDLKLSAGASISWYTEVKITFAAAGGRPKPPIEPATAGTRGVPGRGRQAGSGCLQRSRGQAPPWAALESC